MMLMKIQFLTLLESQVFSNGVYGGDDKIDLFKSLLRGVKPLPFLTGFTESSTSSHVGQTALFVMRPSL
jgi:hypothetical protein